MAPDDRRRIDLAYLAPAGSAYTGLAIEIDGRTTHAKADAFDLDPRRQTALEEAGWLVRRFTAGHLDDREYVIRTVRLALQRIGRSSD
jgi:very-short-patch-repair endonuclease